jgi:hypothetical protein
MPNLSPAISSAHDRAEGEFFSGFSGKRAHAGKAGKLEKQAGRSAVAGEVCHYFAKVQ